MPAPPPARPPALSLLPGRAALGRWGALAPAFCAAVDAAGMHLPDGDQDGALVLLGAASWAEGGTPAAAFEQMRARARRERRRVQDVAEEIVADAVQPSVDS